MAQALTRTIVLGVVVAACSTGPSSTFVAPVDPEVTVTRFMNAVRANDFRTMGQLWGTEDGPMVGRMDAEQLDMRLAVMQRYLLHESYEIVSAEPTATTVEQRRTYQVELKRFGCVLRVPFELVQVGSGWLVTNVDLTSAGNPGRACRQVD